jgi:hypothetical protein
VDEQRSRAAALRRGRQSWTLQWRERDGKWNRYADAKPTTDVTVLLNEIDEDPTGIFWG